ncbi:hypothetical protein ACOTHJ_12670 [Achromobacter xylosoxidans]
MDIRTLDPRKVRDIRPMVLDANGELTVQPASFYAETTIFERAMLGTRIGAYGLPTTELVAWLKMATAGKKAIEIGAGNGVLSRAVGILGTDNFLQVRSDVRNYYAALGQPLIPYGQHLARLEAEQAVRLHKPDIVVACWVTHLFDERRPEAGGNMYGVDEAWIVANCKSYIFIGNEQVHRHKVIWDLPHVRYSPSWLYSKAHNGSPEFIAIWGEQPDELPV